MAREIKDPKKRFAFGKNWSKFLSHLNEDRIEEAEKSLLEKLNMTSLKGKSVLDIGSGSGLFSLAAYRLGAQVSSFDYDKSSVACTTSLKETYAPKDSKWLVQQGSVLDKAFLKQFSELDVVYSWGVLHHTGYMYQALENILPLVKKGGILFISIYNDQGGASRRWKWIKNKYNTTRSPLMRKVLTWYTLFRLWLITFIKDFLSSGNPLKTWNHYGLNNRGMSAYYDLIDWVGGLSFEVATPEEILNFAKMRL